MFFMKTTPVVDLDKKAYEMQAAREIQDAKIKKGLALRNRP